MNLRNPLFWAGSGLSLLAACLVAWPAVEPAGSSEDPLPIVRQNRRGHERPMLDSPPRSGEPRGVVGGSFGGSKSGTSRGGALAATHPDPSSPLSHRPPTKVSDRSTPHRGSDSANLLTTTDDGGATDPAVLAQQAPGYFYPLVMRISDEALTQVGPEEGRIIKELQNQFADELQHPAVPDPADSAYPAYWARIQLGIDDRLRLRLGHEGFLRANILAAQAEAAAVR